jgi:hypothetical protein
MYSLVFTVITAVVLSLNLSPAVASANPQTQMAGSNKARKSMRAFRSEAELTAYLKDLAAKHETERRLRMMAMAKDALASSLAANAPTAAAPMVQAERADLSESVTNVQHAGVDEGSLVKVHGDHLVILRRGRLFTVSLAGHGLTPISSADAFGPDIDPEGTWYDEMLVSDDTVVVIGYSYARGGTEVGLFHIDPAGQLTCQSTYQMRSNDYYSIAQLCQPADRQQAHLLQPALSFAVGIRSLSRLPGGAPVAQGRERGGLPPHQHGC